MTAPLTPEEEAAEEAYWADLHREAYDAVAGADLSPTPVDLDDLQRRDGGYYQSPYYYEMGPS